MEGFSVAINEISKELTARERVKIKDTGNAIKLDEVCNGVTPLVIEPDYFAVLDVHNENSDNKDYKNYVIVDTSGRKYATGSASFWSSFKEIFDEMRGEAEPYSIEVYKKDSKNYKGKQFLTCSIM